MRAARVVMGLAMAALALPAAAAAADEESCRVMEMQFTPASDLQMAIWIEDEAGNFIDTAFVTQLTGTYGLGNRPGRIDFNSEWRWPYGRRDNVLPVWAHRRGVEYPQLIFQDEDDDDLSHPISDSSLDTFYCRPLDPDQERDQMMIDATTCATNAYVDKGHFHPTEKSLYPPRNDLVGVAKIKDPAAPSNRETRCLEDPEEDDCADHIDVLEYAELNDLDAVSKATPDGGSHYSTHFQFPAGLPGGNYVVWIEVSKELDFNASYNSSSYPSPMVSWSQYGVPYRGQPSVLWKVPVVVQLSGTVASFSALEYVGYGDPDGIDGEVNPPDATITTNVEGSGANRLLMTAHPDGDYRFRVSVSLDEDSAAPAAPTALQVMSVSATDALVRFVEPSDDGDDPATGPVTSYEIRYLVGETITDENFFTKGKSLDAPASSEPGAVQEVSLANLLPQTRYSVGIRAQDNCLNTGELAVIEFNTGRVRGGKVDGWCAIAPGSAAGPGAFLLLAGVVAVAAFLRRRQ